MTHNGLQRVLDHPRLHRPLPLEVARGGAGAFGIRQDAEPTVASGQQKFEIIDPTFPSADCTSEWQSKTVEFGIARNPPQNLKKSIP